MLILYLCTIFRNLTFSGLDDSDASDSETKKPLKKEKKKPKNKNLEESEEHPLITDLDYRDKEVKKTHKAELWFERDAFKDLIDEKDEDADLDKMVEDYKQKGAKLMDDTKGKSKKGKEKDDTDSDYSSEESSDSDEDYDIEKEHKNMSKASNKNGFEIVKNDQGEC